MKRFMYFSVSALCLAVAVLIGFQVDADNATAQVPADVQYFFPGSGSMPGAIYALLPNGDIYYSKLINDFYNLEPTIYIGNFWSGLSVDFTDAKYEFYYSGQILALLPGGGVYRGQHSGNALLQTVYVGNFWNGVVSTDQSNWGDIKDIQDRK